MKDLENLTDITQTQSLLNIAQKLQLKGQYLESLDVLWRINLDDLDRDLLETVLIRKAAVYQNMHLIDKSFDVLMQGYARGLESKKIFFALSFLFMYSDNFFSTHYYWHFGMEQEYFTEIDHIIDQTNTLSQNFNFDVVVNSSGISQDDEEYINIEDDIEEQLYNKFGNKNIQLVQDKQEKLHKKNFTRAVTLYMQGDSKKATKLFETIPSTMQDTYAMSKYYLSLICSFNKNYNAAKQHLDKIYDADTNFLIRTERLRIALLESEWEEAKAMLQELESSHKFEKIDYRRLVEVIKESGWHDIINKYLLQLLQQDPYDSMTLILCAISCYNLRQIDIAKKYLSTTLTIYPESFVATQYCQIMLEQNTILPYTMLLPEKLVDAVEKELEEWVQNQKNQPIDDILRHKIRWYIACFDDSLQEMLIDKTAQLQDWQVFLRYLMLKKETDKFTKKKIIFAMIKQEILQLTPNKDYAVLKDKYIYLTIDDLLTKVSLSFPFSLFKTNNVIIDGYWNAFSAIACARLEFWDEFVQNAVDITRAFKANKKKISDANTVAAIYMYYCGLFKEFKKMSACIGFFEADKNTFKKYKQLIEEYKEVQESKDNENMQKAKILAGLQDYDEEDIVYSRMVNSNGKFKAQLKTDWEAKSNQEKAEPISKSKHYNNKKQHKTQLFDINDNEEDYYDNTSPVIPNNIIDITKIINKNNDDK